MLNNHQQETNKQTNFLKQYEGHNHNKINSHTCWEGNPQIQNNYTTDIIL